MRNHNESLLLENNSMQSSVDIFITCMGNIYKRY